MDHNSGLSNREQESAKRMLKLLRILLFIWLVIFITTVLWCYLSPGI